ncbi:MAG TPA: type II toxin-antitoxin system RelE/ParE family toxin [Gammaproteobacteria bacterium]|jgi:mRNA-degrading endonuclease RelE of RelBE toxin-antitoxin system|nr:type II toxin-antitoxin system RelE/ParE family toxin [Gammaproteobacteria bacterium]
MKIIITNTFKKSAKKLMRNQIDIVENVIDEIAEDPEMGELKKGDLAGVRVYKFHIHKQLMLLAYQSSGKELVLLSLNTHENFYRNLKKNL